jgi:hypothetical protein
MEVKDKGRQRRFKEGVERFRQGLLQVNFGDFGYYFCGLADSGVLEELRWCDFYFVFEIFVIVQGL